MLNIVAYGGGTNSSAMLVGLHKNRIPVDLILFADPGGEMPETYAFLDIMDEWLSANGMPKIRRVHYTKSDGNRLTLEEECLASATLPAIAYGHKSCSVKHKVEPQDKFCNHYEPCLDVWRKGGKVTKFVGYDAGESQRRNHAIVYDIQDKKYRKQYPLFDDWGWNRVDCKEVLAAEGLPQPGKSSCFFCPSSKKAEIRRLKQQHPDLLARALAIEDAARPGLRSVKGLGRDWAWRDFIEHEQDQVSFCDVFADNNLPCACFD